MTRAILPLPRRAPEEDGSAQPAQIWNQTWAWSIPHLGHVGLGNSVVQPCGLLRPSRQKQVALSALDLQQYWCVSCFCSVCRSGQTLGLTR